MTEPKVWKGEYDIDDLKVVIYSDRTASIVCYRQCAFSPRYVWSVRVGWFERRRGVTLETKIARKKREVIWRLEAENEEIAKRYEMERRLSGR